MNLNIYNVGYAVECINLNQFLNNWKLLVYSIFSKSGVSTVSFQVVVWEMFYRTFYPETYLNLARIIASFAFVLTKTTITAKTTF